MWPSTDRGLRGEQALREARRIARALRAIAVA